MKHTIFNNYYSSEREDETRKFLFEEYSEENNWKSIEDIPDEEVFKEMSFEEDISWESEKEVLSDFFEKDYFIVYGSFGAWNGRRPAGKIISGFNQLSDAWQNCDYINIYDENGHFYIKCSHHDGTNFYEVKRLTSKGLDYLNNDYNWHDQKAHETAFNCNLFSGLPHYANIVFGTKKYA